MVSALGHAYQRTVNTLRNADPYQRGGAQRSAMSPGSVNASTALLFQPTFKRDSTFTSRCS